ncbi:hypothetical protein KDK_63940 [Dictyobacter kobayashii]|uniref:Uncharacterized protein n=1 Tax=Dictyobacter kobayashii TaxID=2014872 RepID=A0A402AU32_9CHLR|nr:hypothetical protein KDK_63940 [Dictyobacter kobayashii]
MNEWGRGAPYVLRNTKKHNWLCSASEFMNEWGRGAPYVLRNTKKHNWRPLARPNL